MKKYKSIKISKRNIMNENRLCRDIIYEIVKYCGPEIRRLNKEIAKNYRRINKYKPEIKDIKKCVKIGNKEGLRWIMGNYKISEIGNRKDIYNIIISKSIKRGYGEIAKKYWKKIQYSGDCRNSIIKYADKKDYFYLMKQKEIFETMRTDLTKSQVKSIYKKLNKYKFLELLKKKSVYFREHIGDEIYKDIIEKYDVNNIIKICYKTKNLYDIFFQYIEDNISDINSNNYGYLIRCFGYKRCNIDYIIEKLNLVMNKSVIKILYKNEIYEEKILNYISFTDNNYGIMCKYLSKGMNWMTIPDNRIFEYNISNKNMKDFTLKLVENNLYKQHQIIYLTLLNDNLSDSMDRDIKIIFDKMSIQIETSPINVKNETMKHIETIKKIYENKVEDTVFGYKKSQNIFDNIDNNYKFNNYIQGINLIHNYILLLIENDNYCILELILKKYISHININHNNGIFIRSCIKYKSNNCIKILLKCDDIDLSVDCYSCLMCSCYSYHIFMELLKHPSVDLSYKNGTFNLQNMVNYHISSF